MMRFISELIEKKRSDSTPAAARAAALPAGHGVARHERTHPEMEEIRRSVFASVRGREADSGEAPEAEAVAAGHGDAEGRQVPMEPLVLQADQRAEETAETSPRQDAPHTESLGFVKSWVEAEADDMPEECFADDDGDEAEAEAAPAGTVAQRTPTAVDLDRAFEKPLQAFPAVTDEDEAALEVSQEDAGGEAAETGEADVAEAWDAGLEDEDSAADAADDAAGDVTGSKLFAEAGADPEGAPAPAAEPEAEAATGGVPPSDAAEANVAQAMRIWDLDREADSEPDDEPASQAGLAGPAAAPQQSLRANGPDASAPEAPPARPEPQRAGRVKTRLLGFHRPEEVAANPFARQEKALQSELARFPVGWLVIVKGPGRGASYALYDGVSTLGRGEDQAVTLDHGDTSISRENHAAIAYDAEQQAFYIGHGGKANLVRLNGMPVLSTEPLANGDGVRIGETTLRFVALCGPDFSWDDETAVGGRDAARR